MKLKIFLNIFFIVFTLFLVQPTSAMDEKKLTSVQILNLSEIALKKLVRNKDIINLSKFINDARAILIFPEVYEGGLLFGAKGGNGLLIIRRNDGKFSGPFFFSLGGLSFGLQIGAKSGKVLMTVMTNRGLKSVLKERVKLGVDIDAAIISEGVGYSAESTVRLADVYSFSDNKGLFLGGSLEGSYLQPRNDLNFAYHNRKFNADEIIEDSKVNRGIENLENIINFINE